MAERRLVRVFVWKEGSAPDAEYVQQVIGAAVPDSREAHQGATVTSAGVGAAWPANFWDYALPQLRQGPNWTDSARYELAGWAGNDARNGARLFVVSVYERPQAEPVAGRGPRTEDERAAPALGAEPPGIGYGTPPGSFPVAARPPAPGPGASAGAPATAPPAPFPSLPPSMPSMVYPPPAPSAQQPYGLAPGYAPPPPPPGYLPPPPADAYPHQTGITAAELGNAHSTFYSGFGPRVVAGLVDGVLIALFELAIGLISVLLSRRFEEGGPLIACGGVAVGALFLLIYLADFWAWRGQTPGMMMMGLKVVGADGKKPGLGPATLRALGYLASLLTLGIGFLLILADERRQGLHDRIAGTFVVPVHPPPATRPAYLPGYAPAEQAVGSRQRAAALPPAPTYGADYPPVALPIALPPAPPAPPPSAPVSPYTAVDPLVAPAAGSGQWAAGLPPAGALAPVAAPAGVPSFPGAPPLGITEELRTLPGSPAPAPPAPTDEAGRQFRRGLELLGEGVREPGSDRALMIVEPEAGQAATLAFVAAAGAAPGQALYRYFVGVARRYGEGYAAAEPEFAEAQRIDPAFWEAQLQIYFGARWHDAFTYPLWSARATVLPAPLRALLPGRPGSRLVILREGAARTVAVLCSTRRDSWKRLPSADMPARIEVLPTQTPSGLVVALYVALRDDPQNPYRGETFINPAEAPGPTDDATGLGQNLILQLSRQQHTYLIFVDEAGMLLLNRLLPFDPPTRHNLEQTAALVQATAYQAIERRQPMTLEQFQQAARWHIQQFPLERVQI